MYSLYFDKWLGEKFQIIAVDSKIMSKQKYLDRFRDGANKFAKKGKTELEI